MSDINLWAGMRIENKQPPIILGYNRDRIVDALKDGARQAYNIHKSDPQMILVFVPVRPSLLGIVTRG